MNPNTIIVTSDDIALIDAQIAQADAGLAVATAQRNKQKNMLLQRKAQIEKVLADAVTPAEETA